MDAVSALCDAIKSRLSAGRHPGVILTVYVDEVSSLSDKTLNGATRTLYDSFLSAWVSVTKDQPAFLITLSTNCQLSSMAPSSSMTTSLALPQSLRAIDPSACHHSPFTELVFDMLPSGQYLFAPDQVKLSDVAGVRYMVKFGRPL